MIQVRNSGDRGETRLAWLDSKHTFSFGGYRSDEHNGFGPLRVINEDVVVGGAGFGAHPHRDMEILSFVLEGSLEHRDSLGNGSIIEAGEVQRMSAGTGVVHSEFNGSESEAVRFLQIWIVPEEAGLEPGYEQRHFDLKSAAGKLVLLASNDGRDGSLSINRDVDVYGASMPAGSALSFSLGVPRLGWVQVVRGEIELNGLALTAGDGAGVMAPEDLSWTASADSELLLFDMPDR